MVDQTNSVKFSFEDGFIEGYLTGLFLGYKAEKPEDLE